MFRVLHDPLKAQSEAVQFGQVLGVALDPDKVGPEHSAGDPRSLQVAKGLLIKLCLTKLRITCKDDWLYSLSVRVTVFWALLVFAIFGSF